jgi:hypothetical protein
MVLQANKQFTHGLLFNTNYTLSKSMDNGQESTTFFSSFSEMFDPLNANVADKQTPSSFDRRHRFVGSVVYRPDYLWGIGVSSIVTLESGLPINAQISGSLPAAFGATNSSTTNGTGGSFISPWLGRNSERLPGRKTVDLRASKRFGVGSGRSVEVLWEAFNLFNWVNYTAASATAYNVNAAGSTFNAATNSGVVALTSNSGFLVPTTIGNTLFGMRDMQFGLKFSW